MQSNQNFSNTNNKFNLESNMSDSEVFRMTKFRYLINKALVNVNDIDVLDYAIKRTYTEPDKEREMASMIAITMAEAHSQYKFKNYDAHNNATKFFLSFFEKSSKLAQKLFIQKLNDYVYEYDILSIKCETLKDYYNEPMYWRLGLVVELIIAGLVDLDLTMIIHSLFIGLSNLSSIELEDKRFDAGIKVVRRLIEYQAKAMDVKSEKFSILPPPPPITSFPQSQAKSSSALEVVPINTNQFRRVDLYPLKSNINTFLIHNKYASKFNHKIMKDLQELSLDNQFQAICNLRTIVLAPLKFDFSNVNIKCPWIDSDPLRRLKADIAQISAKKSCSILSKGEKVFYFKPQSGEEPALVTIMTYSIIDEDYMVRFNNGRERNTMRQNLYRKDELWNHFLSMTVKEVAKLATKIAADRKIKRIFSDDVRGNSFYNGEINESGLRHGLGVCSFSNTNSITEGMWKDNRLHGKNIERWSDGRIYEGEYSNGMMDGYGEFTWPGVAVYEGQWKNDQFHGQGVKKYHDGRIEEGIWKHGILEKDTSKVWAIKISNSRLQDEMRTYIDWLDLDGNIMFHFNPRMKEGELVMNTSFMRYIRDGKTWASEERVRIPASILSGDKPFNVAIKVTEQGYEVYLNDKYTHLYRHRIPYGRFTRVNWQSSLGLSVIQDGDNKNGNESDKASYTSWSQETPTNKNLEQDNVYAKEVERNKINHIAEANKGDMEYQGITSLKKPSITDVLSSSSPLSSESAYETFPQQSDPVMVHARELDCRIFDETQMDVVFSPFGKIINMELEKDTTSEQKLAANVLFTNASSAADCVRALNGKRFDRFKISVCLTSIQKER